MFQTTGKVDEYRDHGRPVEFDDVNFGVDWRNGLQHSGRIWNPARGLQPDAPPAAPSAGQAADGSRARAVIKTGVRG